MSQYIFLLFKLISLFHKQQSCLIQLLFNISCLNHQLRSTWFLQSKSRRPLAHRLACSKASLQLAICVTREGFPNANPTTWHPACFVLVDSRWFHHSEHLLSKLPFCLGELLQHAGLHTSEPLWGSHGVQGLTPSFLESRARFSWLNVPLKNIKYMTHRGRPTGISLPHGSAGMSEWQEQQH